MYVPLGWAAPRPEISLSRVTPGLRPGLKGQSPLRGSVCAAGPSLRFAPVGMTSRYKESVIHGADYCVLAAGFCAAGWG